MGSWEFVQEKRTPVLQRDAYLRSECAASSQPLDLVRLQEAVAPSFSVMLLASICELLEQWQIFHPQLLESLLADMVDQRSAHSEDLPQRFIGSIRCVLGRIDDLQVPELQDVFYLFLRDFLHLF